MGLLRLATFVAVGVALLPSDRDQQQHLYERAGATAQWVVTFCDRNGPTCAKGSEVWSQFLAKAEFGAKLAYDMMRERQNAGSAGTTAPVEAKGRLYAPAVLERDSGTLTPLDREPPWHGKQAGRSGGI
jgi:hypothetical protein